MKLIKSIIAMVVVVAAIIGNAGESAEFRLDTMDGTRIARVAEAIAYSTEWNNGNAVSVAVDGVAIKEANAPASGDVIWNAAQAGVGMHTLTHTSGGVTLTAVFEVQPPPLTLTAESADWSSGSITLRCEDADTSGATQKYTLEYKNASGVWEEVDDAKNKLATKGQNANGQEVWVVKLTDSTFWSRLGGIPPVEYRVKEVKEGESGRTSEPCVTRTRHGIFVGVGSYGSDYPNVAALEDAPKQAKDMHDLVRGHEEFTDFHLLVNSGARYDDVNRAFNAVAENVKDKPGDICVIYFSTHGNVYGDTTVGYLVLYDKPPEAEDPKKRGYSEGLLAKHIRSLDPNKKGIAVVCIISACHSGAFIDDDNANQMCSEASSWCHREDLGDNVAWITAANAYSNSTDLFDAFMIEYGWKLGWARKNSTQNGKAISFYDLGHYAIEEMYNPIATKLGLSGGEKRNDDVLRNIVAGTIDKEPDFSLAAPSSPFDVRATKDKSDCVRVTWQWQQGSGGIPDGYLVLRQRKDSKEYVGFEPADRSETFRDLPDIASQEHPMKYAVAAYNGAKVSVSDGFAEGWRTINLYTATFYYNLPGGLHLQSGEEKWVSPLIEEGESLTPHMKKATKFVESGEDKMKNYGWTFAGWKNRPGDILAVAWKSNGAWLYSSILVNSDLEYYADWTAMSQAWLGNHPPIAAASNGDIATAAAMTAANGCRTVGECYALGIDPEDPDDDFRISGFEMKDGKPVITLNHTEDGSGNSFLPRVKTLGKAALSDSEWREVPEEGDDTMRFFKVSVEMP